MSDADGKRIGTGLFEVWGDVEFETGEAAFVLAQLVSVEPDGGEVVGAVKDDADVFAARQRGRREGPAIPPFLIVGEAEFFAFLKKLRTLEAELRLHFAGNGDRAGGGVGEGLGEGVVLFAISRSEGSEGPV